MEWIERYAVALAEGCGADIGIAVEEVEAVLDLARAVAHGTERRNAPLAAYLAGRYCAVRAAAGVTRSEALAEATAAADDVIGRSPTG